MSAKSSLLLFVFLTALAGAVFSTLGHKAHDVGVRTNDQFQQFH